MISNHAALATDTKPCRAPLAGCLHATWSFIAAATAVSLLLKLLPLLHPVDLQ